MIGCTAGLGECCWVLCHAHMFWSVLGTIPHVGNSVLRGDAVIRVMMWVVTHHMHGRVSVYVGCIVLKFLFCMSILWVG